MKANIPFSPKRPVRKVELPLSRTGKKAVIPLSPTKLKVVPPLLPTKKSAATDDTKAKKKQKPSLPTNEDLLQSL